MFEFSLFRNEKKIFCFICKRKIGRKPIFVFLDFEKLTFESFILLPNSKGGKKLLLADHCSFWFNNIT